MIEILFIRRVINGILSKLFALADVLVGEKTPAFNANFWIELIFKPSLGISPQRPRCGEPIYFNTSNFAITMTADGRRLNVNSLVL